MEAKRFTLAFLIVIYEVFLLKSVYNVDATTTATEDNDRSILTSIETVQDNDTTNTENLNKTESSTATESTTVTPTMTATATPTTIETTTTTTVTPTTFETTTETTVTPTTFETTTTTVTPTEPTKRLPELPNAFQAKIRYSENPSSTYNVIISYDEMKNRAAITKKYSSIKSRQIYDFKENRILNITDGVCSVQDIPEDTSGVDLKFPFPFNFYDEEKKMRSSLGIFMLDGNDVEVAERQIDVNGVPCIEYYKIIDVGYVEACKSNVSCKMRQFYSNPEWRNPNCKKELCNQTPVRIQVDSGLECYYIALTLSFLEYHEGITDEEEFQQFPGVYCENAKSEPFPTLSSSFSADLVEKDILNNNTSKEKLWWSETANILRINRITDDDDASLITDYNRNLTYNIIKLNTACRMELLYEDKPSTFSFLTGSKSEDITGIQNVGKRKCELSECEVWTGETISGETFDIYLRKQNLPNEDDYTPVFVDVFKNKSNLEPELYSHRQFTNYRPALGDWSAFDMSACYSVESSNRFEFTIKGDIGERWKSPLFRENIYNTIWNHSKLISPLRLQKLQIIPVTNETITVKGMVIADLPIISEPDASYTDISSEDAIKNIQAMSKQEGIFENKEEHNLKITEFKTEKDEVDTGGKKYGPGDMAGLAVGMLLLGIICGAVGIILTIRIRKRT